MSGIRRTHDLPRYMRVVVGAPRSALSALFFFCISLGLLPLAELVSLPCTLNAAAEDSGYNPTKTESAPSDGSEEEEEEKPSTVFSFGRFEKGIRSLCAELDVDQRRIRIFTLAQARAKDPTECPSCRALWRSVAGNCRQVKKESQKGSTEPKKKKNSKVRSENAKEGEAGPTATPEATPTAIPAARMPSTVALNDASLLSTAFYEADPKKGGVFQAVVNFQKVLLSLPNLTIAEKDYYGILMTYILSAWEGRQEGSSGPGAESGPQHTATKQRELQQLFE